MRLVRPCEERSDEAIQKTPGPFSTLKVWVASLRSQ
jgi:hypothetical protein